MKNNLIFFCLTSMMVIASCTSTKITSSWREPDKQVTINKLNKVLVVALLKDETSRRKAEDQMVAYLNGKGIASYKYLDDNFNKKNEDSLRDKIREDGFDGAVTMRLIDVDKEKIYLPGNVPQYSPDGRNFGGYYLRSLPLFLNPGYYATTKKYTVETYVFSIKENKIIWSGLTETTDPEGVKRMTADIARVVYKKMVKEGFVKK